MTAKKSVMRTAQTALTQDTKARDKAAKESSQRTVDSFVNFSANVGIGTDNLMSGGTYGFNPITRNRTLLEWIHRGSWIGGLCVNIIADDMVRAGVTMKGQIEPEDIEQIEEAVTAMKIWPMLGDTVRWDRLYGGALAVMLIDGQDMSTPLRMNTIRKGQFRGLLVLDRWMVDPSLNDLVTEFGPDLGMPKFYRVTASAPALYNSKIHYSRVVRMEGEKLPYWQRLMENMWGISVLERLYDRLLAFDSASMGAAQLVYKAYIRTYKIKDLRQLVATGGKALQGLTAYTDMMRRFQSIEGMTIMDAEDEFEGTSHTAFSGLDNILAQFNQQVSGAVQIPLVRLFGQSPAGLNSTGEADIRNYYDSILQRQNTSLLIPTGKIYRCIAASEGITLPKGFKVEFNPLWQLPDDKKADVAKTTVDTVQVAKDGGLITQKVAMKELRQSSRITNIFSNITDEDIEDAEDELLPPIEQMNLTGDPADVTNKPGEVETKLKKEESGEAVKNEGEASGTGKDRKRKKLNG
jgi:phage-related protein (TIGR01555 family)